MIKSLSSILNISLSDDFSIHTQFDLPNQDIIKADIERVQSGSLSQNEKYLLECCLTKYCKECKISYKQCLNEICAPFVLMTREETSIELAYKYFKAFIEINLTTMFADPVI